MKKVNRDIANWISPYATIIGEEINIEKSIRNTHPTKYFLQLTLPNYFDAYAICLHSYWINNNMKKEDIKEMQNSDSELPEEDYNSYSWESFYKLKKVDFDLEKAILNSVDMKNISIQLNNELYPSEGDIDKYHLETFTRVVQELYGDQEIEVFFHFLATKKWEESKLFEGRISELLNLLKDKDLNFTPSLIYAKDKSWAINTDYDLAFSTIGGESELVNQLIDNHPKEIYKVDYQ